MAHKTAWKHLPCSAAHSDKISMCESSSLINVQRNKTPGARHTFQSSGRRPTAKLLLENPSLPGGLSALTSVSGIFKIQILIFFS